jgi:hypothetical protein
MDLRTLGSVVLLGVVAACSSSHGSGQTSDAPRTPGAPDGSDAAILTHDSGPEASRPPPAEAAAPDAEDIEAYSIVHQPSGSTPAWYRQGLTTVPLPANVVSHLMPNSTGIVSFALDATTAGGIADQPGTGYGGFITGSYSTPGVNDGGNTPMYFGTASDPVYVTTNVKTCGAEFEPHAERNASGVITNLTFHAPSGATYSGYGGGTDNAMGVWDISGTGISNGMALGFYTCCGGATALPKVPSECGGHAGTEADPCPFSAGGESAYCNWSDPIHGRGYDEGGAVSSVGFGWMSGSNRFQEILSGHILHANFAESHCEATGGSAEPNVVFPSDSGGALKCDDQSALAPPNGALFFLDYTSEELDCMNPAMPACTGADGRPVTKLDAVQYIFIEQLARFGAYETDTGGPSDSPGDAFNSYHNESSEPYRYYSLQGLVPDPLNGSCPDCLPQFIDLMNAHCLGPVSEPTWCYVNTRSAPSSAFSWETRIFYGMPFNLSGPTCSASSAAADQCGVANHLHVADPCVAVTMAGLSTGTGGGTSWDACP